MILIYRINTLIRMAIFEIGFKSPTVNCLKDTNVKYENIKWLKVSGWIKRQYVNTKQKKADVDILLEKTDFKIK